MPFPAEKGQDTLALPPRSQKTSTRSCTALSPELQSKRQIQMLLKTSDSSHLANTLQGSGLGPPLEEKTQKENTPTPTCIVGGQLPDYLNFIKNSGVWGGEEKKYSEYGS